MPLAHFSELALQKPPWIERLIQSLGKVLGSGAAPRQPTRLKERRLHSNVRLRLVQALLNRSDGVPDFETKIPAGTHKALIGRI